jgi:phosphonate transport system substrate-binding protein
LVGVAWVPDDPDAHGLPVYFADLLVPPGSSLASFEDLAGCRIGCNDPVSLSGHHSLRIAMRDRGHDPDTFAELIFTGGHQTSLDLLLAGELDAAVIDSVVRTARSRRESAVAELRVLERLGPWPVQALVARADLDRATVDSFRERLLKVESAQEVREELRRAALLGFVPVGTDYIEPVRIALAAAGS